MKNHFRFVLLLLSAVLIAAVSLSAGEETEKRAFTAEDIWKIARLSSLKLSPDGRLTAVVVTRYCIDENKGATIVDLFHLGTDRKVLDVLRDNRRLEKLSLGAMKEMLEC